MAEDTLTTAGIGKHGVLRLPSVDLDSYNIELKDDDGFLGDRASKGAFRKILDGLRKPLKKNGDDPLGKTPSEEIGKGSLDEALVGDDIEAAALVQVQAADLDVHGGAALSAGGEDVGGDRGFGVDRDGDAEKRGQPE